MRYAINARLKALYSKENITYILGECLKQGYSFYAFGTDAEFLTLDLAVEGIMQRNAFGQMCIMAKRNDAVLDICIIDRSDSIGVSIGNFEDENLEAHIQFFLEIIHNFALLDIYTMLD